MIKIKNQKGEKYGKKNWYRRWWDKRKNRIGR